MTVVSPPDRITHGAANGWPRRATARASGPMAGPQVGLDLDTQGFGSAIPQVEAALGPTPRLALSGTSAFVTDPAGGKIHEFYLATGKQGLSFDVGGAPSTIAGGPSGG